MKLKPRSVSLSFSQELIENFKNKNFSAKNPPSVNRVFSIKLNQILDIDKETSKWGFSSEALIIPVNRLHKVVSKKKFLNE